MAKGDTFSLDLRAFQETAKGNAVLLVRRVSQDVLAKVVFRSPVDTGRFRANWNVGLDVINTSTNAAPDKSGQMAINGGTARINSWTGEQIIYMTNSLPYAIPLEYGHSQQAPAGMVRITVTEFQTFVNAQLAAMK